MTDGDSAAHILLNPKMDRLFDVLSNRTRRRILLSLKQGAVETEAEIIERDGRVDELSLRHTHLPKLRNAGYVEWNPEARTVSKGPRFQEFELVLKMVECHVNTTVDNDSFPVPFDDAIP